MEEIVLQVYKKQKNIILFNDNYYRGKDTLIISILQCFFFKIEHSFGNFLFYFSIVYHFFLNWIVFHNFLQVKIYVITQA